MRRGSRLLYLIKERTKNKLLDAPGAMAAGAYTVSTFAANSVAYAFGVQSEALVSGFSCPWRCCTVAMYATRVVPTAQIAYHMLMKNISSLILRISGCATRKTK